MLRARHLGLHIYRNRKERIKKIIRPEEDFRGSTFPFIRKPQKKLKKEYMLLKQKDKSSMNLLLLLILLKFSMLVADGMVR